MKEQFLRIENLDFSYRDKKVLENINVNIEKGDFIAVLGKSGVGKSTLLRCINLLNRAQKGKILLNNIDILKLNKKSIRNTRQNISFIFQDYNVLDNLYTIENVLIPLLSKKNIFNQLLLGYKKKDYELGLKYLEKVGLRGEAFRKTKYLSGGQKQRVAIAKALCQNSNIILADEPVSSLDEKTTDNIMKIFKKINDYKKITIIMNLHDVAIAKKYSKKILGLKDGEVLFFKNVEDVTADELKKLYE